MGEYAINPYSAFIVILLKELNGNVEALLRIVSIGVKSDKRLIPGALYRFLIKVIKEAVVISNYKDFVDSDGFISIVNMAKTLRFKKMDLDRQTIIRTFRKYDIKYNSRR